ncbi:hypothetical protein THASP1DRAFT_32980 [Thamnocephalis sphaerospora]|uniref:Uncharacterized protein n=1 Tax=Thamnocephalis sphaerospora TaxID=78915 RepID=A0A4V1IVT5_9FUNG|nr:hypothetical protein THASP1DRAFT_32980 [Thamnocephalis sphaerospora]|eukprot:RKP05179.1 hypothetical protein THASP1DRAFT_32980 [Thamnocephalis sphaerospora]
MSSANKYRSSFTMQATGAASTTNIGAPVMPRRLSERRSSITAETNTATPSAAPFVPSEKTLDHSLVVRDNTGLAALSANQAVVVKPPRTPVGPARYHTSPRLGSPQQHQQDLSNTHDDELVRFPTAIVPSTALDGAQLAPGEFGRITEDVRRVGGDHCPPDWDHNNEELDWSSVPGASDKRRRLRSKL